MNCLKKERSQLFLGLSIFCLETVTDPPAIWLGVFAENLVIGIVKKTSLLIGFSLAWMTNNNILMADFYPLFPDLG